MNVAFDPWIPVVTVSGEPLLVSLAAIFTQGDKFADLSVRPHQRVSLMRLLLCVAHAALDGPKDYDEWLDLPRQLPDAAQAYLTVWRDSFELFHPTKPWLQAADVSKKSNEASSSEPLGDWTPVSKLNFSFASGNNSTLFDHHGAEKDRKIHLAGTILSMLTFQCFSTGGLISQVFWHGKQTAKSAKDAPCIPSSMIHALLRDTNVLKSVWMNLPTYEDIKFFYPDKDVGTPVWEKFPKSFSDVTSIDNATTSYLGRLVPVSRLIRLHPSRKLMLLGSGLPYPSFAGGFSPEPSATVLVKKNGKKEIQALLSFNPSKEFWRELSAMIVKRKAGQPGGPVALNALQEGEACDLVVSALAREPGRETILEVTESVFHISSNLSRKYGATAYEEEVNRAEFQSYRLGRAIEAYRYEVDGGWDARLKRAGRNKNELRRKLHSTATRFYWTAVEQSLSFLWAHIDALNSDNAIPTRDVWRKMLFSSAQEAYRIACGQETPRQVRAFALGWKELTTMQRNFEAGPVEKMENKT